MSLHAGGVIMQSGGIPPFGHAHSSFMHIPLQVPSQLQRGGLPPSGHVHIPSLQIPLHVSSQFS